MQRKKWDKEPSPLGKAKRQKEVLSKMLKKGVSVRQAARMTGVPKTTVARCIG